MKSNAELTLSALVEARTAPVAITVTAARRAREPRAGGHASAVFAAKRG